MNLLKLILIFLLFECIYCDVTDPYKTLNLPRNSGIKEIKRAYKSLAKEWHPDKSDNPKAHEKFMEITQAYEILSDPIKKERFDKFGTIDESQTHDNFFHSHHYEDIFGFASGFYSSNSYFSKHRITLRIYEHSLLEKSYSQPILVFAYSSWCNLCFRLQPIWQSVVEDLEPLGYGIGTVNAMTDANLLERMRVTRVPSILVIVEGRIIHFREPLHAMTAKSLRLFARNVLPSSFLLKIRDHNSLKRFVDQWESSNKISVLVVSDKEDPRMRYMLTAMKYATFARFAYVYLDASDKAIRQMQDALGIKCFDCENVFIFNEYPQKGPVAHITARDGKQISMEALSAFIEKNQHLVLPRLASQTHLDQLCPISPRGSRKFCVILAVDSGDSNYISSLRNFVSRQSMVVNNEQFQFAYVFLNKQRDFMEPFLHLLRKRGLESNTVRRKRDLIVIWRLEYNRVRFAWLYEIWDSNDSSINESGEKLKQKMEEITRGTVKLELASLAGLIDEYRPSWFTRFARSAVRMAETAWFHLTKEEALPVLSAVGTFLGILLLGYGLSFANRAEERRRLSRKERQTSKVSDRKENEQWHPDDPPQRTPLSRSSFLRQQQRYFREMEPHIHELRAETYFGLVKLLKPGCRSIIVLVDKKSKDVLLPQFAKHIWPFRNNKTFSFGYLMVEKNLPWFRKLLEYITPGEGSPNSETPEQNGHVPESIPPKNSRLKNINPSQTVGTVLVLCGWKLYYHIYHPMFSSPGRKNFLGFEDDGEPLSSDESDDDVSQEMHMRRRYKPKVEDVLNGLPNWLDRLFEGSIINRYYIPEWPDNLK